MSERTYYITDYGLKQVEIVPASPTLDDRILGVFADFPDGMTKRELMHHLGYEETAKTFADVQRTLRNLMNAEYVVYEDKGQFHVTIPHGKSTGAYPGIAHA